VTLALAHLVFSAARTLAGLSIGLLPVAHPSRVFWNGCDRSWVDDVHAGMRCRPGNDDGEPPKGLPVGPVVARLR
jgi:hypothetical protein